uniref:Uncharacterized protein n=1 Tax=Arundo donax TaxID=35708 RepID=A0A0A8ZDT6_ARUDO
MSLFHWIEKTCLYGWLSSSTTCSLNKNAFC